eukprot:5590807-Karenia_brevis.AAC.1
MQPKSSSRPLTWSQDGPLLKIWNQDGPQDPQLAAKMDPKTPNLEPRWTPRRLIWSKNVPKTTNIEPT